MSEITSIAEWAKARALTREAQMEKDRKDHPSYMAHLDDIFGPVRKEMAGLNKDLEDLLADLKSRNGGDGN